MSSVSRFDHAFADRLLVMALVHLTSFKATIPLTRTRSGRSLRVCGPLNNGELCYGAYLMQPRL